MRYDYIKVIYDSNKFCEVNHLGFRFLVNEFKGTLLVTVWMRNASSAKINTQLSGFYVFFL